MAAGDATASGSSATLPQSAVSSKSALAMGASPKTGTLPPLKKKSVTVKEAMPPPVPPRGSSPRANISKSGKTVRVANDRAQNLSTGNYHTDAYFDCV